MYEARKEQVLAQPLTSDVGHTSNDNYPVCRTALSLDRPHVTSITRRPPPPPTPQPTLSRSFGLRSSRGQGIKGCSHRRAGLTSLRAARLDRAGHGFLCRRTSPSARGTPPVPREQPVKSKEGLFPAPADCSGRLGAVSRRSNIPGARASRSITPPLPPYRPPCSAPTRDSCNRKDAPALS